jgi:hypothetical protein
MAFVLSPSDVIVTVTDDALPPRLPDDDGSGPPVDPPQPAATSDKVNANPKKDKASVRYADMCGSCVKCRSASL